MPAVKRSAKAAAKPAASKKAEPKVEKAPERAAAPSDGPLVSLDGGRLVVDLARIANSPQTEREAGIASLRRLVDRFAADPHGVIEP